jgi:hypothetical protein
MKKDYTHMYVLAIIVSCLFGAIALAEFLKWSDKNPHIRYALGIDKKD